MKSTVKSIINNKEKREQLARRVCAMASQAQPPLTSFTVEVTRLPLSNAKRAIKLSQLASDAKVEASVAKPSARPAPPAFVPQAANKPKAAHTPSSEVATPTGAGAIYGAPTGAGVIYGKTAVVAKAPLRIPPLSLGDQETVTALRRLPPLERKPPGKPMQVPAEACEPGPSRDGWVTYMRDDGTPYFYHMPTGTTAWDWRQPLQPALQLTRQPPRLPDSGAEPNVGTSHDAGANVGGVSAKSAAGDVGGALKLDRAEGGKAAAWSAPTAHSVEAGDPTLPWSGADWDIVLVLPLEEEGDEAEAERKRVAKRSREGGGSRSTPRNTGCAAACSCRMSMPPPTAAAACDPPPHRYLPRFARGYSRRGSAAK